MKFKTWQVVLILFVSLFVISFFSPEAAATLTLIYFFAGMFWLIVKACKALKRKFSKSAQAERQPEQDVYAWKMPTQQQAQPSTGPHASAVVVTKSATVPVTEEARPRRAAHSAEIADAEDDIAYSYTNVGVFVPFTDVFDHPGLVEGAIVSLRQEPTNKFDSRAVAVVIGRKRIGYMYRGKLQDMANDWLDRGDAVGGRIVRVAPDVPDAKNHGVAMNLYFYN